MAKYVYSSLLDYVDNKDLLVLHPYEETMDITDSIQDCVIMNDVLGEETVHLNSVSQSISLLYKSQQAKVVKESEDKVKFDHKYLD